MYYHIPKLIKLFTLNDLKEWYSISDEKWNKLYQAEYIRYTSLKDRTLNKHELEKINTKECILVGAGARCARFMDIMQQHMNNIKIISILDNDSFKTGLTLNNVKISLVSDLSNMSIAPETLIIITVKKYELLLRQIKAINGNCDLYRVDYNGNRIMILRCV